jgi:hypothetical protein
VTFAGSIRWIALALLGLAVAAGVSVAASHLVSQRIGLAAEPVSAGRELAPAHDEQASGSKASRGHNGERSDPGRSTSSRPASAPPSTTTGPSTSPSTVPAGGGIGESEGVQSGGPDD